MAATVDDGKNSIYRRWRLPVLGVNQLVLVFAGAGRTGTERT